MSVALAVVDSESFGRFWGAYPRHVAKQDARKAWTQLAPSAALVDQIVAALAWQCLTDEWIRDGGRYVPYPASWLRGHRWDDEPVNATRVSEQTLRLARASKEFLDS